MRNLPETSESGGKDRRSLAGKGRFVATARRWPLSGDRVTSESKKAPLRPCPLDPEKHEVLMIPGLQRRYNGFGVRAPPLHLLQYRSESQSPICFSNSNIKHYDNRATPISNITSLDPARGQHSATRKKIDKKSDGQPFWSSIEN